MPHIFFTALLIPLFPPFPHLLLHSVSVMSNVLRLALYGDSLLAIPCNRYGLLDKLHALINADTTKTRVEVRVSNHCWNGAKAEDLLAGLPGLLEMRYDMVIVLWDSDCSNIDEEGLAIPEKTAVREQYRRNILEMFTALHASSPRHVCLSGPVLLGEVGPYLNCCLPKRFQGKSPMLDEYRALNRDVARETSCQYLDLRSVFQSEVPACWPFTRWWCTTDGEHFNEKGTEVVAKEISRVVLDWVSNY